MSDPSSKFADRDAVEAFAASASPEHVECRELGHNWKRWTVRSGGDGTYDRGLRCDRCWSVRWQQVDSFGRILRDKREYPEGYLAPRGFGRISSDGRSALRLSSIRRDLEGEG